MQKQHNQHEVEHLKMQIDAEYKAGQRAIYELALGLSKRQCIIARLKRMGLLREKLAELIGEKDATRYMIAAMKKNIVSQTCQRKNICTY